MRIQCKEGHMATAHSWDVLSKGNRGIAFHLTEAHKSMKCKVLGRPCHGQWQGRAPASTALTRF